MPFKTIEEIEANREELDKELFRRTHDPNRPVIGSPEWYANLQKKIDEMDARKENQVVQGGPIVIDFTNVKTGGSPVSEGRHIATVFDAKMGETRGGDPMLNLIWKVQPGEDETEAGRQVYDRYPIMESTWWKLKLLLEGLGEDVSGSYAMNAGELVGKVAAITIEHETYEDKNGNERVAARVARVESVQAGAGTLTIGASASSGPGRAPRGKRDPF